MTPALPQLAVVEIVGLVASPGTATTDARGRRCPSSRPTGATEIEVRAGFGIVGDRYAGKPAHRDASVTVIGVEPLDALAAELGVPPFDPLLTRRNVVLRGADVEACAGRPSRSTAARASCVLRGGRPANPCAWMDVVLAPGAHRGMRGRGGIRCAPRHRWGAPARPRHAAAPGHAAGVGTA